ncbi:hypothetical protein H9Y04_35485 [Streptomyces sp. TRM66268-LWL]|uniref:Uncharacterized protein n=1 Tax=Streptomyces polyasparticus TaxID=2767826 RepID=A0ABR7SU95_9ACTN|nr:hypothetical protein [Streptomyces polyasparticus]MBC9717848.1 hypothetical protein [Streptomyces polyasparticus]
MNARPTRPPLPLAPLGYRRDGRPVLPILGASAEDPGEQQHGDPAASSNTPPPPTDQVSFSQDELSRRFTREKDQGRRAGIRELLSQLGFDNARALQDFVHSQREAEQSRLSDLERREQELAVREQQAAEREAQALTRERDAARRSALVGLGSTGTELEDATVLLARASEEADDDAALRKAAERLKSRRPELFGQQPSTAPPSGSPDKGTPARTGGTPPRPGTAGLDMARRRGHLTTGS